MADPLTVGLESYILSVVDQPPRWGENDCVMFVAGWIKIATGHDPALSYRGTYRDEASCLELIARHGGMHSLVASCLKDFRTTYLPRTGDVAVLVLPHRYRSAFREVMGIRVNGRWAIRGIDGVAFHHLPLLTAWSIV